MSDNMKLWASVMKTDPNHTKPITGKSYKGNSPKPYWLVQRATETFGPCGIGWGFKIVEEKLLEGARLKGDFYEKVHIARVSVWYTWDGKRGEVEHVGQTVFCGLRASGATFTDEDAPKKSVTDALVKALSMLGFAGDIFIGLFDDSKYVNELRAEMDVSSSAPSRSTTSRQEAEDKTRAKVAEIVTTLAPMDSYEIAAWLSANPKEVEALRWVKKNLPELYAEVAGLGVEV